MPVPGLKRSGFATPARAGVNAVTENTGRRGLEGGERGSFWNGTMPRSIALLAANR